MEDKIIHMTTLSSKIKEIFDKDKLETSFINARNNLDNNNESIDALLRQIDTFMEDNFFTNYFKHLITCIDLNYCKEYEYDDRTNILYSFKMVLSVGSLELLIYELDIGLSYLYQKLQDNTYKEIINKILRKYNLRAINHSVVCISDKKTYEITVDVILTKGALYDYLIEIKDKFLKGEIEYDNT